MENKFTVANLLEGFYNAPENTYDLRFENGWIKGIPANEHPEAETDEFYWDNQDKINEALEQGDVE
ncbi:hypothetical protein NHG23_08730 [Aerococcaceae bacterium NML190073]|nr:hypothetical protein [Aerococcaceae bacterium NML190073]